MRVGSHICLIDYPRQQISILFKWNPPSRHEIEFDFSFQPSCCCCSRNLQERVLRIRVVHRQGEEKKRSLLSFLAAGKPRPRIG